MFPEIAENRDVVAVVHTVVVGVVAENIEVVAGAGSQTQFPVAKIDNRLKSQS